MIRALIIFVLLGISGAIVGMIISSVTGIGLWLAVLSAIVSGLFGLVITVEKSEEERLMDDLDQMEALSDKE
jgi:uncharacterized protein (DUF58 family)